MFILAACDSPLPTPTPTRAMSAPTLAASPVILPLMPAGEPTERRNAGQSDPTAAALPSGAELPPLPVGTQVFGADFQTVEITTSEGVVEGDLYPNPDNIRMPGVLLLASDRSGWLDYPLRLQAAGFTVLSVSMGAFNSEQGARAAVSLLPSLIQVGTVDPSRIAVVAVDDMASSALIACAVEPLCDALAILNPTTAPTDALFRYNPRPLFIAAFTDAAQAADLIRASATGDALFLTAERPLGGATAGQTLIQPPVGDQLIEWLTGRWSP